MFIVGVVGHNGFNSCLKCTTEGEYSYDANTMIFPELNAPLRTDAEFRSKCNDKHNKTRTIIESVIGLDMINDFPIGDVLHLIDLGITKRFLSGWKKGNLGNYRAKWSGQTIANISKFLVATKMPKEIKRPMRSLDELAFWKATEFRSFLLYLSVVITKKFFDSNEIFEHFLHYFCAITICSRHDQPASNLQIARKILLHFLEGVKIIYGKHLFTSNMHNLCHLMDDVEKFGPLDSFSTYPFESKLYYLKNLIRSGRMPLTQIANRLTEIQSGYLELKFKAPEKTPVMKYKVMSCNVLDRSVNFF